MYQVTPSDSIKHLNGQMMTFCGFDHLLFFSFSALCQIPFVWSTRVHKSGHCIHTQNIFGRMIHPTIEAVSITFLPAVAIFILNTLIILKLRLETVRFQRVGYREINVK